MSTNYDTRALVTARFDQEATCLECGDNCERWRIVNGLCPGCREIEGGNDR